MWCLVSCSCQSINVHAFELVKQVGRQLVQHLLVLQSWPSAEFFLLALAFDKWDKFSRVERVVLDMARDCAQWVHVISLTVGVDVAESLGWTEDCNLAFLDRGLVISWSMLVSEVNPFIDLLLEVLLDWQLELGSCVPSFSWNALGTICDASVWLYELHIGFE